MSPKDQDSLAWSLAYAARRLAGALALAAPSGVLGSHMLRGCWAAACRELHYLEMMVRRLLVAMAGQLEVQPRQRAADTCEGFAGGLRSRQIDPVDRFEPEKATAVARPKVPKNRDTPLLFPALDRKLGPKALQARLAAMGHWEGETPAALPGGVFGAPPAPHPVIEAASLARRFASLAAVLSDPAPHAARLARQMARGAAPLRLGTPPVLARGGTMDIAASAYREAERLALSVLNRGAPFAPNKQVPQTPAQESAKSGFALEESRGPPRSSG